MCKGGFSSCPLSSFILALILAIHPSFVFFSSSFPSLSFFFLSCAFVFHNLLPFPVVLPFHSFALLFLFLLFSYPLLFYFIFSSLFSFSLPYILSSFRSSCISSFPPFFPSLPSVSSFLPSFLLPVLRSFRRQLKSDEEGRRSVSCHSGVKTY